MKKTETIDLKGKNYATVPARIKEFRQDCPYGLIETTPTILPDWKILFKARILKDKSNPDSAEWTGHAIWTSKADKDFEKLETIAVWRALAMLWYMASGDIASSEEWKNLWNIRKQNKKKN